jgi:peptide/nickel transport system permease protein
MNRVQYFGFRLVQTVLLLLAILTGLFVFFRLLPGSYADIMVFQGASQEAVEQFRIAWGLNDPLYVQYYRYIDNLLHLEAGTSLKYRTPVYEHVKMKIFNSFILIAPGVTFAYILGSVIGTVFGSQRGSRLERYGLIPVIASGSFPSFFTSIVLIIVFASWLNWFPTSGMLDYTIAGQFADGPWWRPYLTKSFALHYVLPFTAVVFRYLYLPTLIMRTNVVETIDQEFFHYLRITGLPKISRLRHLAKHSSLPVITLYPVSMTRAIGGLVLIETVFNWPGIGFALVEAVLFRDTPVVQFVFFLVAAFVVVSNFVVDIVYTIIDPRIEIGD